MPRRFQGEGGGLSGCPGFCARGHPALTLPSRCPLSRGPGWSHVGAPPASLGLLRGRHLLSHLQSWLQGWRGPGCPLPVPRGTVHLALQSSRASPWGLGSPASDTTWCEVRGPPAGPRLGSSSPCPPQDPSAAASLMDLTQARVPGTPGHVAAGAARSAGPSAGRPRGRLLLGLPQSWPLGGCGRGHV